MWESDFNWEMFFLVAETIENTRMLPRLFSPGDEAFMFPNKNFKFKSIWSHSRFHLKELGSAFVDGTVIWILCSDFHHRIVFNTLKPKDWLSKDHSLTLLILWSMIFYVVDYTLKVLHGKLSFWNFSIICRCSSFADWWTSVSLRCSLYTQSC